MNIQALRRQIAEVSRKIWEKGWVANHDGNITVRVDDGRLLATPTAVSKGAIREEDVLLLDAENGAVIAGSGRPFSELYIHQEFYRARADVAAVIHAHPPVLCSFAVAGHEVEPTIMPEPVVSLGPRIPLTPVVQPGSIQAKHQIRALGKLFDVILLGNHGPVVAGEDLEQAFLRLELAEHVADIQQRAAWLGGARRIPDPFMEPLMASRKKAGLGPEARGPMPRAAPSLEDAPIDDLVRALVEDASERS